MSLDAEFFVALGFVLFVVLLGYMGVHKQLLAALDGRTNAIAAELAEAQRLREEAAGVLASYEKKRAEVDAEAQAIIAKADAEALMRDATNRMIDFVDRHTRQAEEKISMAEEQARSEVRAAAADAAIKAVEIILHDKIAGELANDLIMKDIGELKSRLN